MKTRLFPAILLLMLGIPVYSQIDFDHDSWAEIKAKAKKENKLIFVDAFTTWCGPCKWMAKNVFTNDTVARYFNEHFVNAKIDMEAGEGKDIAKLYGVNVYPSLLFINGEGELVHKGVGAMQVKDFVSLGQDANNPEKQLSVLEKKFEKGQADKPFLLSYLKACQTAYVSTEKPLSVYFQSVKPEDLPEQENWDLIVTYEKDFNSKVFQYLMEHSDKFSSRYTGAAVDKVISEVVLQSASKMLYSRKPSDIESYPALKMAVEKGNFKGKEELLLSTDQAYYEVKKDTASYASTTVKYIEKFKSEDAAVLNNSAWGFYEKVKDKNLLLKAEGWAKKSFELSPESPSLDTYASLLYINGKKKEAIESEEKALRMEQTNPDGNKQMVQEYMDKLKKWRGENK